MNENRGLWRGRSLRNKEWVTGYYVCLNNKIHHIYIGRAESTIEGLFTIYDEVDPSTLGECAGLPDKNGKTIFEGDICTVAMSNISDDEYGIVVYDEDEAVFIIDFGTYTINFCNNVNSSAVEIVGNIHDNPELLKGGLK